MILLDGRALAKKMYSQIAERAHYLLEKGARRPCLGIVLVGDYAPSHMYVASKIKAAERVHFSTKPLYVGEHTPVERLREQVCALVEDPGVDGVIVQLPLPGGVNKEDFVRLIPAEKDVDGFHPDNVQRIFADCPGLVSATPYGIVLLLQEYGIDCSGKHVVIVGRSHIVGKPLALLLSSQSAWGNATVTLCHSQTKDVGAYTRQADIVVVAVGVPYFLRADMVKEGAVVVDVGIHRIADTTQPKGYRVQGDACFDELVHKVSHITPVPGGVGPMTVAALMQNTMQAYEKRYEREFLPNV